MRELPKFAVERLMVSTPPGLHPDADVLTAFAERSLPASERAVVLEHLARCGDCRSVVALALPATEAVESRGVVDLCSRWRWPILRGAAVAAGVVAVAAVGIYQYQHRSPTNAIIARNADRKQLTSRQASNETKTAAPQPELMLPYDQRHEITPSPSAVVAAKPLSSTADSLGSRAKSNGAAAVSGEVIGGPALHAKGTKMAMAQPPRDLAFASPQPPPAKTMKQMPALSQANSGAAPESSEVVEVQGETVTAEVQAPTRYAQNAGVQAPLESGDKVRRAKPAVSASGGASAAAAPMLARNQTDLQQLYGVPMPRWTINATGGLQRSLDGGKTWQDMNVNARPDAYGSLQGATVAENRTAKVAAKDLAREKNLADKEEKLAKPEAAPLFRAVCAIGDEVWAGGSGGWLYHSPDAGATWTSIIPSAQGVLLSGDIIHIEFSDLPHGSITTSTSEIWTTADGGRSWRKQ